MGHEILYCSKCQIQLRTADFEKDKACRISGVVYCFNCAQEVMPSPPPETLKLAIINLAAKEEAAQKKNSSTGRIPRASDGGRPRPPASGQLSDGGAKKLGLAGGIMAGIAGLGLLLFVATGTSSDPPRTPRVSPPSVLPKPEPDRRPEDSAKAEVIPSASDHLREKAAHQALERARGALQSNPEDLEPVVALFEQAQAAAEHTGFAAQAYRELAAVAELQRNRTAAAITAAESESRSRAAREEFRNALDMLEKARRTSRIPVVREALQARAGELEREFARLHEDVRSRALDARRRGAEDEVKAVFARIDKWGDPPFVEELKQVLASVPAPPSKEAGEYRRRWVAAMEAAASRDAGGALRILQEATQGVQDPKVREEGAQDLASLKGLHQLYEQAAQAFARLQKGQKVSLEFLDDGTSPRRVEGVVVRSGPGWVAVKQEKGLLFVDWNDLTATALADLVKDLAAPKELSLLSILAGRAPGGDGAALPDKYRTYASERGPGGSVSSESEARRLFHSAYDPEREWSERRRKGDSISVYRRLLAEFSETAFVRRRREQIGVRAGPPTEIVFQADDLKGHGTFRLDALEKGGAYWAVSTAPAAAAARDNFVEVEFEAGGESAWKAWVYAGACCADSLSLYWQATELCEVNSKGQKVGMDPGSEAALGVKAVISKLPRTHASHASKPEPVAFAWIALAMPKFSAAGPKKARLLADRPGVAIKAMILSTVRATIPTDADAKELEQESRPGTAVTRGLVGWWKLDERSGPSLDASGHNHTGTWVNSPTFTPQGAPAIRSNGGCLTFSGEGQYVDLANPGDLPSGTSPRSLCAWAKPELRDGPKRFIAAFGTGAPSQAMIIGINGKELYGGGYADDLVVADFWDTHWHHVALTYDGTTARLYGDGVERASMAKGWNLNPRFAHIGKQVERPQWWIGLIDDVRIYSRALSESEIKLLAQGR